MQPVGRLILLVLATLAFTAGLAVGVAHSKPVKWNYAGASVFGGACEGGWSGYKGDYLPNHPNSFAELGMGNMLGLPYKAKVRFLHNGRKVTGRKRDIGGGGNHVKGKPRIFDFWEPLLTKLLGHQDCNWTGVVAYRRL